MRGERSGSLADFVRDVEALMEWTSHGPLHITKGHELLSCFSEITTLRTFFFLFSPIKTWTAVREPGVCESRVREVPVEWKTSLFEL
ncbi:hypothetical protein TNCV_1316131 [Trichonephila clavipes]|nr:hypothetical protein TNCV_1316131 [Trichonephila clavipes]